MFQHTTSRCTVVKCFIITFLLSIITITDASHSDILFEETVECDENELQCSPDEQTLANQCQYIKSCCTDTLSDDGLINYLRLQYCTFNTAKPLGIAVLTLFVVYTFIILGNVAGDYFAPTMAELADFLGVPHELAGVTFVAIGNEAPDIFSAIEAISRGGNTTKLGLAALLGAAIFDSVAISGFIAILVDKPTVARRPFLRDCLFLFIAAGCVLSFSLDGKIYREDALGMVAIYVVYVSTVLLGEIYKYCQRKKERELEAKRKMSKSSRSTHHAEPEPQSLTDRLMPALSMFSNESMRDLFKTSEDRPHPVQHSIVPVYEHDLQNAIQNGVDQMYQRLQRKEKIPSIRDLYRRLEEEESTKLSKTSKTKWSVTGKQRESTTKLSQSGTDKQNNSALLGLPLSEAGNSESSTSNRWCHWRWMMSLFLYILRGPTLVVELLCKLTIPMTDENWNDWIAIITCTTAPVLAQFAFASNTMSIKIGGIFPVALVVVCCGLILSLFTYWRIRIKYLSVGDEDLLKDLESKTESMKMNNLNGAHGVHGAHGHGPHGNFHSEHSRRNQTDIKKKPVMKLFFLIVGFVSSIGWIELVANELVNLLTTLGVISTIDLAILGMTVLAWGNSISDLIADITVARNGYAKMGISAAIGGPVLTVLIGVGVGTTVNVFSPVSPDGVLRIPHATNIIVCALALILSIAIYAIWTATNEWTLKRSFGYFCCVYYFGFLAVNVLAYEGLIALPFAS